MTYHVNHNDTAGPEPINWEPLILTPLPWAARIKGFLLALIITFTIVTFWAIFIIGLITLI